MVVLVPGVEFWCLCHLNDCQTSAHDDEEWIGTRGMSVMCLDHEIFRLTVFESLLRGDICNKTKERGGCPHHGRPDISGCRSNARLRLGTVLGGSSAHAWCEWHGGSVLEWCRRTETVALSVPGVGV